MKFEKILLHRGFLTIFQQPDCKFVNKHQKMALFVRGGESPSLLLIGGREGKILNVVRYLEGGIQNN